MATNLKTSAKVETLTLSEIDDFEFLGDKAKDYFSRLPYATLKTALDEAFHISGVSGLAQQIAGLDNWADNHEDGVKHDDRYYRESEIDTMVGGRLGLQTDLQIRMWTGTGATDVSPHDVFLETMDLTEFLLIRHSILSGGSESLITFYTPHDASAARYYNIRSTLVLSAGTVTYASRIDGTGVFGVWDSVDGIYLWIGYPASAGRGVSRMPPAGKVFDVEVDLLGLTSDVATLKGDVATLKQRNEVI